MHTTTDYSRDIDFGSEILCLHCDEAKLKSVAAQIVFETEDSHSQPEPSFASRIRSKDDIDFVLLYLPLSKMLGVYCQSGIPRETAISSFFAGLPEFQDSIAV